ncbi:hypothetical protein CDL15_Pgr016793 [Punica granatum]|nr:hypothetical protein CDL15_Pgr016793 [Punica granatum]
MSRFGGSSMLLLAGGVTSNLGHKLSGNLDGLKCGCWKFSVLVRHVTSGTLLKGCGNPALLKKMSSFMMKHLLKEADKIRSLPLLSIAAVKIPPLGNICLNRVDVPQLENADEMMNRTIDRRPCEVVKWGCAGVFFPDLQWKSHKIEPITGIEFPLVLDSTSDEEKDSSSTSEILVGTGSRTMRIVKIKSMKVYAFGFYIHPGAVCQKMGPKYASLPTNELSKRNSLYEDLLREDISMTVRLVVNCNGMKINSVKDAFEKSLRARLLKTNPNTDYACLSKFRSIFTHDIPIPAGTKIDFHRTADGNLITEIGGNKIGAVQSKELCRAFFDMYIGDLPVSEQTKEEIGKNIVGIIRRC